jgi:putative transposase
MKSNNTTLSYDICLPDEIQEPCLNTLDFLQPYFADLIKKFWTEDKLKDLLDSYNGLQHWKLLEQKTDRPKEVPSRIWRGILDIAGRILLTQAERMDLFYFLADLTREEKEWSWELCKDNGRQYTKSNYVYLLQDNVRAYREEYDKFPDSYFDLVRCPVPRYGIITYAPDDGPATGQAIRYSLEDDILTVRLKVFNGTKWVWIEDSFELPETIMEKLNDGGKLVSPDLRRDHKQVFLDVKIKVENESPKGENIMVIDWGTTRKLLTMLIVTPEGEQISQPIFLKYRPILGKMKRIRSEIDHLYSVRSKHEKESDEYKKYSWHIAQNWNKFRNLQKELAHLASNTMVDLAMAYEVKSIYVEDLAQLSSWKFSRELNRLINNTVRSQIYDKVRYKGKLKGIKLERPVKAYWTSQTCPISGIRGKRYHTPNRAERKGGGWFKSKCFSADADYVACLNLARRVLFGFSLNHERRITYTVSSSDVLFRPRWEGISKLRKALKGWNGTTTVTPVSVLYQPLRA